MDGSKIRTLSGGVNQRGLRDHNARMLLSIIQRNGPMPGSDLARVAGLSPQTVSVILRKLEKDGWQLLNVMSTFAQDGLAERKSSAGKFYLKY